MEITFDKHGLISQKEIIEVSLEDLERVFVNEQVEKEHRARLFEQYLTYTKEIEQKIGAILFQFVNGSFTTLKEQPNDIDVVSFVDYRVYQQKTEMVERLAEKWANVSGIDGYVVARSYPGHPHFIYTQLTYEYWLELFSQTKPNEDGVFFRKGLIKLNHHE